jgi:hypothetical protein
MTSVLGAYPLIFWAQPFKAGVVVRGYVKGATLKVERYKQ